MKASVNAQHLLEALAFVTKGVRGKRERERAKALLLFRNDDICVEFNDLSANYTADVFESGKYALNPFIFRPFIETFGKANITVQIDREGITIGRTRLAHIRVHGRFDDPDQAVEGWAKLWNAQSSKRQKRLQSDEKSRAAERRALEDRLSDARYIAFKRTDGGIEYGAVVLKYEKGEPGKRKIYVKTKDFQEVWINELEIVSYGKDPELSAN